MSNWLLIENGGELDPVGLRLLGASTKRGDKGKIGFFGTGWKYALAVLMRAGAQVRIFCGTNLYSVEAVPVSLRGQEFREIVIVGPDGSRTPTGVTTEIGPKWELWMAVREVLCNALDEPEPRFEVMEEEPVGEAGKTRVWIDYATVRPVWDNRTKYFRLDDTTMVERAEDGRVLQKVDEAVRVYRKGILVFEGKGESLYDYDLDEVSINEERLSSEWDVRWQIWNVLDRASVTVKKAVLSDMKAFEKGLPTEYQQAYSARWVEALGETVVTTVAQAQFFREELFGKDAVILPDAWVGALRKNVEIKTVERALNSGGERKDLKKRIGADERKGLRDALKLLARVGIEIEPERVVVVEGFEDVAVLGKYEDGNMLLARRLFGMGFREVVKTILEEWAHGESKAGDKTREFQDFLFNTLVKVIGKATKRVI